MNIRGIRYYLPLFLLSVQYCEVVSDRLLLNASSFSQGQAIALQSAKDATYLSILIKSRVKIMLDRIYNIDPKKVTPVTNPEQEKYFIFLDRKGGLGNQVLGLASALLGAACTGRKLAVAPIKSESIADWLWGGKGFFEPPFSGWNRRKPARSFTMKDFLQKHRESKDGTVTVSVHQKEYEILLRTNEDIYSWTKQCLLGVEDVKSSPSYDPELESYLKTYDYPSFQTFQEMDEMLSLYVLSGALGAISWNPTKILQSAIDETYKNWGIRGPESSVMGNALAIQVRACLDCGWKMLPQAVRYDIACDVSRYDQVMRGINPKEVVSRVNSSLEESEVEMRHDKSFVFVTTESGETGGDIENEMKMRFPNFRIKSTTSNLTEIQFLHTTGQKTASGRLSPVLDWYLLGEFNYIGSCGTSFTQTAVGRRPLALSLPQSVMFHEHYSNLDLKEDEIAGDKARQGRLSPLTSGHNRGEKDILNFMPPDWQGCRNIEIMGKRFMKK